MIYGKVGYVDFGVPVKPGGGYTDTNPPGNYEIEVYLDDCVIDNVLPTVLVVRNFFSMNLFNRLLAVSILIFFVLIVVRARSTSRARDTP